ncbi:MAG: zf-HC2 domain-containing protein [Bdellovibrionales bacterium]|nr:zf-HC2 domain-containing protein [Bdellovibrionales bacterium]
MSAEIDPIQAPFLELTELECSDVGALTSCYVDGEMLHALRTKFDAHLAACPLCQESVAQTKFVVDSASTIGDREIPREAQLRLREALRDRVGFNSPKLAALRQEN